jgi:hypothetical protein
LDCNTLKTGVNTSKISLLPPARRITAAILAALLLFLTLSGDDSGFNIDNSNQANVILRDNVIVPEPVSSFISGLWSWSAIDHIKDKIQQENFFRVVTRGHFNQVYLRLEPEAFVKDAGSISAFIARAHSLNINIYIIVSRHLASTTDKGELTAAAPDPAVDKAFVESLLRYNSLYTDAKFDGIIWDIEPLLNNMLGMTEYMHSISSYSFDGRTLRDQGMTLALFCVSPEYMTNPRNDPGRFSEIETMFKEFDLIVFSTYWDDLEMIKLSAGGGPQLCEALGIDFLVGFESDEHTTADNNGVNSSLYQAGKQRYYELVDQCNVYFAQWASYRGTYLHHWMSSVNGWWDIEQVRILEPQIISGSELRISVRLNRGRQYSTSIVGIKASLTDGSTIIKTSRVVALDTRATVILTLQLPDTTPPGRYTLEVSSWDMDVNMENGRRTSLLLQSLAGFDLESLRMNDQLFGNINGARSPFVKLDAINVILGVNPAEE